MTKYKIKKFVKNSNFMKFFAVSRIVCVNVKVNS